MSVWKKTMLYLGLGADEEYDETFAAPAEPGAPAPIPGPRPNSAPEPAPAAAPAEGVPAAVPQPVPVPVADAPVAPATGGSSRSSVRPLPPTQASKPHVVAPRSFNDGQEIADRFKTNQPVIVNLQDADKDLSRRIIDFASGLCYGLRGHMEKVATQVYLLTPADVEVSAEERRELRERGLHDA